MMTKTEALIKLSQVVQQLQFIKQNIKDDGYIQPILNKSIESIGNVKDIINGLRK